MQKHLEERVDGMDSSLASSLILAQQGICDLERTLVKRFESRWPDYQEQVPVLMKDAQIQVAQLLQSASDPSPELDPGHSDIQVSGSTDANQTNSNQTVFAKVDLVQDEKSDSVQNEDDLQQSVADHSPLPSHSPLPTPPISSSQRTDKDEF